MMARQQKKQVVSEPIKKTMSDKTRYIIVGVGSFLVLALVVALIIIGNNNSIENAKDNSVYTSNAEESGIAKDQRNTSTDALKEFYKEFDSETLNVIFYARASCSFCQLQKPILEKIIEDYDIPNYILDTDKLSSTEKTEITNALGLDGSTPITLVVKNGEVVAKTEGYLDGKPYVEFLKTNKILPEDATYLPEDKLVDTDYNGFKKLAKEKGNNLLLLDSSASQVCIDVRKLLNEIATKNNFKINYLSSSYLTQDEVNDLVTDDFAALEYKEEGYVQNQEINIPVLLVVGDNKIKDYVLEGTDESDYTKMLQKYGFID